MTHCNVLTSKPNEFRSAQAGLNGQKQNCTVPSSAPGSEIRGCKKRFSLGSGEECDRPAHISFARHREHPLRESAVLRGVQRNVMKE